uniref:Uncharacterized protein n=1 Tax=Arundo donax TaxID=35708 RepID=A0A0A8Y720_ARUDO
MTLKDMVWDDEPLHSFDSHGGLLDQVAQGGEYLVSEERKATADLLTDDVHTRVSGGPFRFKLRMDVVSDVFNEVPCPDGVSADKDGEAMPCLQEAWVVGIALEVLDEMHHKDVVWDKDMLVLGGECTDSVIEVVNDLLHDIVVWPEKLVDTDVHDGLLLQIAQGEEYLNV